MSSGDLIQNSAGKVFYGLHMYPGLAQYQDSPSSEPYRIFINEDTIRKMSPSFEGKPIFVDHVDGVDQDIDSLRTEADGWVIGSFFNSSDGKTWAKFVIVSDRGLKAIQSGWKLSNAYVPKDFGPGGMWNGMTYAKEVTSGEFEHLAIVQNPRYEESQILTPEQFKRYNEGKELELKRLANSKEHKEKNSMKFDFFKKAKVENDLDGILVVLPKSKKEVSITKLVNDADVAAELEGKPKMANGDDEVMVGNDKMKLNDLLKKHEECMNQLKECMNELAAIKEKNESEDPTAVDNVEADKEREAELEKAKNADEEVKEKKDNEESKKSEEDKKENSDDAKGKNFEALKNAHLNFVEQVNTLDLMDDKIARGKARYGSK